KGFPEEAERLGDALNQSLDALSGGGKFPVVTDASTCAKHIQRHPGQSAVADSAECLLKDVPPRVTITRKVPGLAVHHNCSAQRLKEQATIEALARAMAEKVVVLSSFTCCGYGGDRGLFVPELNAHATRFVKSEIPADCT